MGKIKRERYDDYQGEKHEEDRRLVKYEENRHEKYDSQSRVSYDDRHRSLKYEDDRHKKYNLQREVSYEEIHAREVLNSENSDNENTASSTDGSESSSSGSEDSKVSIESEKRKRSRRKKAKIKKEKYYRGNVSAESDEDEIEERGRHRKRKKITEEYEDGNYIDDRKHRSRSHKRKHKHKRKHRRRRHYGSEESSRDSRKDHGWGEEDRYRRGRSLENVDSRREEIIRGKDDDRRMEDKRIEKERRRDKREDDRTRRRGDREDARRERRENRRAEEQEERTKKKNYVWNPTSRWDDDEEETSVQVPVAQEEVIDDPSRFIPGRERKKAKVVTDDGNADLPKENTAGLLNKVHIKVKKKLSFDKDTHTPPMISPANAMDKSCQYPSTAAPYIGISTPKTPKKAHRWVILKINNMFLSLCKTHSYVAVTKKKTIHVATNEEACTNQY
ncbi:unnamed protein product, partial [Meganyctiphanes norvegica]